MLASTPSTPSSAAPYDAVTGPLWEFLAEHTEKRNVAAILLALGMSMVAPTTISVPFKLLLFVMLEGWTQLIQGLVLSYR
ncbi:hypothetical protein CBM2587_B80063 [Cupriavidus taiwanensis]|uniref:Uncharacterized protein n=1 Tax=Cupriavidus taiwanensis TaxID=164546 RepID=A0A375CB26_9BURK|nr:hypothetical protein CBM2587_B80063 [Cupriavidus taiwanensis]